MPENVAAHSEVLLPDAIRPNESPYTAPLIRNWPYLNRTDMRYLPPFDIVKQECLFPIVSGNIKSDGSKQLISQESFVQALRLLLRGVQVDEHWYVTAYPDIAEAIAAGAVKSAKNHFVENGYFEGRLPFELSVDEDWYLSTYPDVAEGITRGDFRSAKEHFQNYGYKEGRLPAEL
jgi:hypothetical protein